MRALRQHEGPVRCLAYGPDGLTLATGDDLIVRCWDLRSGRVTWSLPAQGDWVRGVAFSGDGRLLAVGAWDGSGQPLAGRAGPTQAVSNAREARRRHLVGGAVAGRP
jgi:WD40 repeat protein